MSTYTQILYQIVFSTKHREKVMVKNNRELLYKYIAGLLRNKKCHVYQINGVDDHLHIAMSLHPSVSLSAIVKDVKVSSSIWIKENKVFPKFKSWQSGYGAFTYSMDAKENLINYIFNQEKHHAKTSFYDEYKALLEEYDIAYEEKYLF